MTAVLADTSAWIAALRSRHDAFFEAVEDGDVLTFAPVTLELLAGLRRRSELQAWRKLLGELPGLPLDDDAARRGADVLVALAGRQGGSHRAVPATDLLVAAAAERAGLAVLHRDAHFEQIAAVTGQVQLWFGAR